MTYAILLLMESRVYCCLPLGPFGCIPCNACSGRHCAVAHHSNSAARRGHQCRAAVTPLVSCAAAVDQLDVCFQKIASRLVQLLEVGVRGFKIVAGLPQFFFEIISRLCSISPPTPPSRTFCPWCRCWCARPLQLKIGRGSSCLACQPTTCRCPTATTACSITIQNSSNFTACGAWPRLPRSNAQRAPPTPPRPVKRGKN